MTKHPNKPPTHYNTLSSKFIHNISRPPQLAHNHQRSFIAEAIFIIFYEWGKHLSASEKKEWKSVASKWGGGKMNVFRYSCLNSWLSPSRGGKSERKQTHECASLKIRMKNIFSRFSMPSKQIEEKYINFLFLHVDVGMDWRKEKLLI
jgi:hypothetical protein